LPAFSRALVSALTSARESGWVSCADAMGARATEPKARATAARVSLRMMFSPGEGWGRPDDDPRRSRAGPGTEADPVLPCCGRPVEAPMPETAGRASVGWCSGLGASCPGPCGDSGRPCLEVHGRLRREAGVRGARDVVGQHLERAGLERVEGG